MIRFEFKKNLIYNRFILIIIIFLSVTFFGTFVSGKIEYPDDVYQNYYYEKLGGSLTYNKLEYLDEEVDRVRGLESERNSLSNSYRKGTVNDIEYISKIKEINEYDYKRNTIDSVVDYVAYLETDNSLQFVDERYIESLFSASPPYLLIGIILLLPAISYTQEQGLKSLSKTTILGKNKLRSTKLIVLISINVLIATLFWIITYASRIDLSRYLDLMAPISSARFFAGTFFTGSYINLLMIHYLLLVLGVVLVTVINILLLELSIFNPTILFILEIGSFLYGFTFFLKSKWLYYFPFIGFFNPTRYFMGNSFLENNLKIFSRVEFISVILFALVLLLVRFISTKKLISLLPVFIFITGCTASTKIATEISFTNNNGISCNEIVCVNMMTQTIYNIEENTNYELNRNPLLDVESISTGFMYHDYYYMVINEADKWSIHVLNTKTFEQEILYENKTQNNFYGNSNGFSTSEAPDSIYVQNKDIYLQFRNHLEVLDNSSKRKNILRESVKIINVDSEFLYVINDKMQLEKISLSTFEGENIFDTLVVNASIYPEFIYYQDMKNETIRKYNKLTLTDEVLVSEPVMFYQVDNDEIIYTLQKENTMYSYNENTHATEVIMSDSKIYGFNKIGENIIIDMEDKYSQNGFIHILKEGVLKSYPKK